MFATHTKGVISWKSCLSLCLLIGLFTSTELMGQCREDMAWESAWESCETSPSPNPARENSHWLFYDLGHVYALGDLQIWNANKQGDTQKGIKRAVLDYSMDGETWKEFGEFELSEASGLPYYSGERAATLEALQARFVLLTVLETWGDPACVSIHELSFKVEQRPVLPESNALWAYPNPTLDNVNLNMELVEDQRIYIEVMDILGRNVKSEYQMLQGGRNSVPLSLMGLRAGAYIIRVSRVAGELIGVTKVLVLSE